MVKDPYLADVFKEPPLIAYKRAQNIKDKIIRAKVPPLAPLRPRRVLPGMSRCKGCPICPFIKQGKSVRAVAASYTAEILQEVNCKSKNVIYCIECRKCKNQYIGETNRSLQDRFSEQRGYVSRKMLTKSTGEHFNTPGHNMADMQVTILEQIFNSDRQFRKTREKMYIERFNTKYKGLNKKS